jgi:hypothetical protein
LLGAAIIICVINHNITRLHIIIVIKWVVVEWIGTKWVVVERVVLKAEGVIDGIADRRIKWTMDLHM